MIDGETLDKIRKALPQDRFRAMNLSIALRMNYKTVAFALGILKRLGEVRRVDVRVDLGGGYRVTRSFWRKNA